jgi:hypothetical protein
MADDRQYENTRNAIGVMTGWATGTDTGLALEQVKAVVEDDGVEGLAKLTAGLINLCGLLLLLREKEKRQTPEDTLRYIASGPLNTGRRV